MYMTSLLLQHILYFLTWFDLDRLFHSEIIIYDLYTLVCSSHDPFLLSAHSESLASMIHLDKVFKLIIQIFHIRVRAYFVCASISFDNKTRETFVFQIIFYSFYSFKKCCCCKVCRNRAIFVGVPNLTMKENCVSRDILLVAQLEITTFPACLLPLYIHPRKINQIYYSR